MTNLYNGERWADLAVEAGFNPERTESAARQAFRFCADKIEQLESERNLLFSHAANLEKLLADERAAHFKTLFSLCEVQSALLNQT